MLEEVMIPQGYHPVTGKLISILKDGKPGDFQTDRDLTVACMHDTSVGGNG